MAYGSLSKSQNGLRMFLVTRDTTQGIVIITYVQGVLALLFQ